MFVFTAKLDKKKLRFIIAGGVLLVIALIALLSGGGGDSSPAAAVASNDQRVDYLASLGWEADSEPLEVQTVVIPKQFGDVYAAYAELQRSQGYDLSQYAGLEAVRYTYRILNHPAGEGVVADMIVYRNKIIAGDIQSTALDGFMTALEARNA